MTGCSDTYNGVFHLAGMRRAATLILYSKPFSAISTTIKLYLCIHQKTNSGFALMRTIELSRSGDIPGGPKNRRISFVLKLWLLLLLVMINFRISALPESHQQSQSEGNQVITLSFQNQTVCRGEIFSISLQSTSFEDISSFYIRVSYNPQQLSFQASENYVSSIPNFIPIVDSNSPGFVGILSNSVNGENLSFDGGNVIDFFFIALIEGEASLSFDESTVFNAGQEITVIRQTGQVQINNGPEFTVYGRNNLVSDSFKYCKDNELEFRVLAQATSYSVLWKIPNNALITGQRLSGVPAKMQHNGEMYITVSGSDGCSREKTIGIEVFECGLRPVLPNAFRPSSEIQVNRTFRSVFTKEQPYIYSLQVFDRWGNLVFETNSLSEGWDGTYKGQMSEPGIYSFIITFSMAPNIAVGRFTSTERGTVLLLR